MESRAISIKLHGAEDVDFIVKVLFDFTASIKEPFITSIKLMSPDWLVTIIQIPAASVAFDLLETTHNLDTCLSKLIDFKPPAGTSYSTVIDNFLGKEEFYELR